MVNLVLRRLVMDWFIEVVHAEEGERHFLLALDILLCHEVLVRQELILILLAISVELLVVVKVLGEDDVECAIVIVVLHELVAFDHGLLELREVVLEELEVGVTECFGLFLIVLRPAP